MNIHEYQAKELYRQYNVPTGIGYPVRCKVDAFLNRQEQIEGR